MMKIFALAMLLTVMQAAPPVPRKAPDTKNDMSQNVATKSNDQKDTPTESVAIPNTVTAAPDKRDSQNVEHCNAGESIRVSELPSVSVSRDWIDCVALLISLLLLGAGAIGVWAAWRTLKAIEAQTVATQKTLILTQRPRIVVRAFYFSEIKSVGSAYSPSNGVDEGSWCTGQYYIQNCGGTDARIREIYSVGLVLDKLPMKRPYEGKIGSQDEATIRPGQSATYLFHREPMQLPLDAQTAGEITAGAKSFYVLGQILYSDDLGIWRTTAFCRRYDAAKDRFLPVDDADYEYAD